MILAVTTGSRLPVMSANNCCNCVECWLLVIRLNAMGANGDAELESDGVFGGTLCSSNQSAWYVMCAAMVVEGGTKQTLLELATTWELKSVETGWIAEVDTDSGLLELWVWSSLVAKRASKAIQQKSCWRWSWLDNVVAAAMPCTKLAMMAWEQNPSHFHAETHCSKVSPSPSHLLVLWCCFCGTAPI